ncbi:MAG: 50S ribosomal protein L25/general stress protein Ctc [Robiginitomaculum sp.]|nr:MAG: 50S ribosomal protein L25/general stress protein Ctc [Robiginitomaculum sp.]
MADIILDVEVRELTGTGNARAVRRANMVPAIIYGGGEDPVSIQLKTNEVLKAINSGQFISKMVKLSHKGKEQFAMTHDIQFHPVKETPQHVDFFRVTEDTIITVEVKVNFVGEEECPGLKQGGTLNVVRYTIEVRCPAGKIPAEIEIDLSTIEMGESLHISEITFPEGVTSAITDRDPTILTVVATRGESDDDEDEGEATEGEAAEGEEAPAEEGEA